MSANPSPLQDQDDDGPLEVLPRVALVVARDPPGSSAFDDSEGGFGGGGRRPFQPGG